MLDGNWEDGNREDGMGMLDGWMEDSGFGIDSFE